MRGSLGKTEPEEIGGAYEEKREGEEGDEVDVEALDGHEVANETVEGEDGLDGLSDDA